MNILAVDTSSAWGLIALGTSERLVGQTRWVSNESHSARVMPEIEALLSKSGLNLDDIDVFGATVGPGSFTGLRIGLATLKGFAWAKRKPSVGIGSLEVLALSAAREGVTVVPMIDARKERVFAAAYRLGQGEFMEVLAPDDIDASEFVSRTTGPVVLLGSGARKYEAKIKQSYDERVTFAPLESDIPSGEFLIQRAYAKAMRGEFLDVKAAQPVYLRKSEAEIRAIEAAR